MVTLWTLDQPSCSYTKECNYDPELCNYDVNLYLTYHGTSDVWPWWTNDFQLTDVQAPYGT